MYSNVDEPDWWKLGMLIDISKIDMLILVFCDFDVDSSASESEKA